MRSIKDTFWIKIEKPENDTINLAGKEIYLDTSYNPMYHARQYGVVFATPVSTSYKFDVKKGDKVWFHHFVANKESKVNYLDEGDIYSTSIDNIYLRERDGELKSLHHWNFIEQIYEDEDSIKTKSGIYIKPEVEEITHSGIVRYISDSLKEMGVNVNDKIMFTKDSEYNMDINGDKLMRMRDVDILCTYE